MLHASTTLMQSLMECVQAANLLELNGKLITEKQELSDQLTAVLQELYTARTSIRQMTEDASGEPVEDVPAAAPIKRSTRVSFKAVETQVKIARRIKVVRSTSSFCHVSTCV